MSHLKVVILYEGPLTCNIENEWELGNCFSHVARTVRSDLCGVLCACFLRLPWSQPQSRGTCPVSCGLLRSHFPSELFFVKGKVKLGLFFSKKPYCPGLAAPCRTVVCLLSAAECLHGLPILFQLPG